MEPNDLAHAWCYKLRDTHAKQLSNTTQQNGSLKQCQNNGLLNISYLKMNPLSDIDAVRVKVAVSRKKLSV